MTAHVAGALLISLAAFVTSAHAQSFPSKSLRIIVPFPPGGAADITSRLLGERMAKGLGQPVIAENRPGAGAVIGYELAARAPGDGHTLLVVFPSFIIQPAVKQGLQFDPLKDFKAVGQTISLSMAFAVNPSVPAKSIQELVALAREARRNRLRNARRRHHSPRHRRDVQARREHQHRARACSGRGAGAHGRCGRPHPHGVRQRVRGRAVRKERQDPPARRHDARAHRGVARCSDHARSRISRGRIDELERAGRAERDSAVRDLAAERGAGERAAQRADTGKTQDLRNVPCPGHAGAVRCALAVRSGAVR